ncbi:hypothetical protein ACWD6R_14880 [Streptomyces sp. NPDC005151]
MFEIAEVVARTHHEGWLAKRTGENPSSGDEFTRGETQVNPEPKPASPFTQQGGPHMSVASEELALRLFKVEISEA